ncbi:hypothetical protein GCM10023310_00640 [Paenibacillus vulneris]
MKVKPVLEIDPYFNDIPWEIVYDNNGKVIGEVYVIPHHFTQRGRISWEEVNRGLHRKPSFSRTAGVLSASKR